MAAARCHRHEPPRVRPDQEEEDGAEGPALVGDEGGEGDPADAVDAAEVRAGASPLCGAFRLVALASCSSMGTLVPGFGLVHGLARVCGIGEI